MKLKNSEDITMNVGSDSEIGNNDVQELVPEVEITKLVSFEYLDSQ